MYGVEIWGWEEKGDLEKIMLDYVRWIFRIDLCTPRYIILKKLGLEAMRIRCGLWAREFEKKVKEKSEENLMKICWREKENLVKKELYSRQKERYYNRNGWSTEAIEEMNNRGIDICRIIRERERDIQGQTIEGKIREANYNKRYRELVKDRPHYLLQESLDRVEKGDMVRALVKARCGNLEEANKYWCQEELRTCIFCRKGLDSLDHFMEDCEVAKQWFEGMGNNKKEKIQRIMIRMIN